MFRSRPASWLVRLNPLSSTRKRVGKQATGVAKRLTSAAAAAASVAGDAAAATAAAEEVGGLDDALGQLHYNQAGAFIS